MPNREHIVLLVLGLVAPTLVLPHAARAHGGGLDGLGCHHDHIHGGYHCHRGPLQGRSFASKAEAERARRDGASQPECPASSRELVVTAQNLLRALGYEPGAADGRLGPRTVSAIRAFQRRRHLPVDGQVSGALLVHLSKAIAAGAET